MMQNKSLADKMMATICRFNMVDRGHRILVAVSGGPDSVALLYALSRVSAGMDIRLHVAHLNHSFRGDESDLDAEYVRELSASLGLESTIEKIDVPGVCEATRSSAEEAARHVRYEFLERTADAVGAHRIALAHTADDQIETALMNYLRGTGIDGLAGMPPVRGRIIRPLIEVGRTAVEDYIAENSLHPRLDSTNLQPIYTRNRIRLELLPMLRRQYSSEIGRMILRLAELARDDSAYLNREADLALHSIALKQDDESLVLDAEALAKRPIAIKRRVTRQAIRMLKGDITDIGYVHVQSILRLLDAGGNFDFDLPHGVHVERVYGGITFRLGVATDSGVSFSYDLLVPGMTEIPEIGISIETSICGHLERYMRPPGGSDVILDYDRVSAPMIARSWLPGDRIRPLGMIGSKKLQDIFSDMKVPKRLRCRAPVIADSEKIVWVAGLLMSESVMITQNTHKYLHISIL